MSNEPKTYEIETLNQLINVVTPENIERLSTDLIGWLYYCNQFFTEIKKKDEYKDKLNSEISEVKFVWVDDGENLLLDAKIINTKTGEVRILKKDKP